MAVFSIVKTIATRCCGRPGALLPLAEVYYWTVGDINVTRITSSVARLGACNERGTNQISANLLKQCSYHIGWLIKQLMNDCLG